MPAAMTTRQQTIIGFVSRTILVAAAILSFVVFARAGEAEPWPDEEPPEAVENVETNFATLPVLTSVDEIRSLKREQAALGYPAKLRGVVTCVVRYQNGFVIQGRRHGIYIVNLGATNDLPQTGNLLAVEGRTDRGSFAPVVRAQHFGFLGEGKLPEPMQPTWDQLLTGSLDDQWVEIKGVVERAANHPNGYTNGWSRMMLHTRDGTLWVDVQMADLTGLESYENALVRLRGCLFAVLNTTTRQVEAGHVRLYVSKIIVDEPAPADLFSVPKKSADELMLFDPQASAFQRVKVSGQIIFIRSTNYFLMDGTNGLRFIPKHPLELKVGDLVEVTGFPELSGAAPLLNEAVARATGRAALPEPRALPPADLPAGIHDATLVRIEGLLTSVRQTATNQIFEIQSGSWRFLARLDGKNDFARPLRIGSRLSLDGVYAAQGASSLAGDNVAPFDLLLRSPSDIKVLAQPSWWTFQRLLTGMGILGCLLIGTMLWITQLHRQVEERTAQLEVQIQERQRAEYRHAMEQERARIARDLHDELGSSITEIGMLASRTKSSATSGENRDRYLEQMDAKACEMVGALDEIVWAMNPTHDSLASLVSYFCLYADRFLVLANIRWQIEEPGGTPDQVVNLKSRHQLFLVFKEALNNIVRHSKATEVRFRIQAEGGELRFSIFDNGCGMPAAGHDEGTDGLSNMRTRIEKLGGRFEIATETGRGTTLKIFVPASQNP
jgi:signal transduction histidine kinase